MMIRKRTTIHALTLLGCLAAIAACGDDDPKPPPTAGTGGTGAGGEGGSGGEGGTPIPVWDLDRSRPLSGANPGFEEVTHPLGPGDALKDLTGPLPTNAGWMNFVLGSGDQRFNALPYDLKTLSTGLAISVPEVTADETSVTTKDALQLRLTATEIFKGRRIKAHDLLSVTVEWTAEGGGTMTTPIVQGMPYVTAQYDELPPSLLPSENVQISAINGDTQKTVSGNRFEVSLSSGQTWLIYADPPLTLMWTPNVIMASEEYTGSIRVALAPTPEAETVLDEYAKVIPLGGDIEASVDVEQGTASASLVWKTKGGKDLLVMAMPHHVSLLKDAEFLKDLEFTSVVGPLKATVGSTWQFTYPLNDIAWDAPREVPKDRLDVLLTALDDDKEFVPDASVTDPYTAGKELAKLARLVQIAEVLQEQDTADELRDRLQPLVASWLDGTNENPLTYDTTWGGLVTTAGIEDANADSGNGYYNDHHFQYGYFIYAAAVAAKGDKAWSNEYGRKALWLVRDIANPSANDKSFPAFRHLDWFRGHSWASGLSETATADGTSQRSPAEAIHAWYSIQLLGNAIGDLDVENLGRLLVAVETASAQTYWQVTERSNVYPAPFKDNLAVGTLWTSKADFATSLGDDPAVTYGTQLAPVTPISEVTLSEAWITEAWPLIQPVAAETTQEWRGILTMAQAVVDVDAAWEGAQVLTSFDEGNSLTATLYWIATRP